MSPSETLTGPIEPATECFHCGEPVPAGQRLTLPINGVDQPLCCRGCQAVARTIVEYGLENFYKHRTKLSVRPDQTVAGGSDGLEEYDDKAFQAGFIEIDDGNIHAAHLLLEDVVCPACTWLIESRLVRLAGVTEVTVNYSSNRARIRWDETRIKLSDILQAIVALGYRAYPYDPQQGQNLTQQEGRAQLRRLGLAGLLGMQVMMLSIATYVGDWHGMEAQYRYFFYWLGLLLTTPVVVYSARPFFQRAWRDLRLLRTGMDVPISLGIAIAYLSSVHATVNSNGHVYYDSVVMFVFLLLTARYLEFTARKRATQHVDRIGRIIPAMATRLRQSGEGYLQERVAVMHLRPGDRALVRPGEVVPADGIVVEGKTTVDESIVTGESQAMPKSIQDTLIGGSTNRESPVQMRVDRTGADTVVANILRLLESEQAEKPALAVLANRIAAWFVFAVLILAVAVAWYWWQTDREMWLPVTLSLLVITCPCALSLATPVAVTTASTALMRRGMAVVKQNAIETLAQVTIVVFDKTGTLTDGLLKVSRITCRPGASEAQCLTVAAALEKSSEHPIARAVVEAAASQAAAVATNVENHPGAGVTGFVQGKKYFLGTGDFILEQTGVSDRDFSADAGPSPQFSPVILADNSKILCVFYLFDGIRPDARSLIDTIRLGGRSSLVLSGDAGPAVQALSGKLGITKAYSRLTPEGKLARLKQLIARGEVVAMVGDGVNDAPVLAAAHVSIAMGSSVDITRIGADMILLNNRLDTIGEAISLASGTLTIIRQNLLWAIAYNALALPAAAMGMVAPWMAAIGMSASSLVVVGNSLRLGRWR